MRLAVLGRTRNLLAAAKLAVARGHDVPVVWTCPHEPDYDVTADDFEQLATSIGAAFHNDVKVNNDDRVKLLRGFDCDIALSVNWLTVIRQPVIESFPFGILNAHAGDLPRFRGNACPNWAIINDEPHVGLCIIRMSPELDAGPVVLRETFELGQDIYVGDVMDWLEDRTPSMLVDAAEGLFAGDLEGTPQPADPTLSLRAYPRRPSDGLIDWRQDAEEIHRLVRAVSSPYHGAFTTLEGARKVTVWRAEVEPVDQPFLAIPGQVCRRGKKGPVIACGQGMLCLTEVEVEGGLKGEAAKAEIARSLRNRLI